MNWFARRIHRYETRRWKTDDNRLVRPFAWGLEHIGGPAGHPAAPADDYRLDAENVLTFTSSIESPFPENNTVHAQFFPAKQRKSPARASTPPTSGSKTECHPERSEGPVFHQSLAPARRPGNGSKGSGRPAVLILPNWNAKWHGQRGLGQWLQRIGISALKMSLPYHDRRMAQGHERADQLVGPNIGLTLQANRQAVQDARRCLRWLEQQGFTRLGILGTSIGSSVGYITLVHDAAVRVGGFFHVSTYFADVVSQGMTTAHVWESLRQHVTVDELREYWAPVSPMPYVERGLGAGKNAFLVYGKYDPTFLPALTEQMLAALRRYKPHPRTLALHCGHYSLELPPFSHIAGYRMLTFLRQALA